MEHYGWQTQLSSIRERTETSYKANLFCDVKFTVFDSCNGCNVTIPANKYILAVSSPVFAAMFYGNLAENQDIINLPDCTKEGLQEMLHYVHSDEVNLSGQTVMEVLYIAEKYILPFLVEKCKQFIKENLKPEEVFDVLPQTQHLGYKQLQQHCWRLVDKETERAISSSSFLDVSKQLLCQILNRESLKTKEIEIFRAVDRWATIRIHENGLPNTGAVKREILGEEVLKLIRFSLMSREEIFGVVFPCGVLKVNEQEQIVQCLDNVPPLKSKVQTSRCQHYGEHYTGNRFNDIFLNHNFTWSYEGVNDAIDFSVSKPIDLIGIRLFGSRGSTYKVDLGILKNDQVISKVCSSYESEKVQGNSLTYDFKVSLDTPVHLDANVWYTIIANIKGPNSCYGCSGQEVITANNDLKITFKKSRNSTNGTTVASGQIPGFFFSCLT